MLNSKILILALFLSISALSGCSNTLDGAGRDIESGGEWIQNTF